MHGKPVHGYDDAVDAPRCGKGIYPEIGLTQDLVESRDPCRSRIDRGGPVAGNSCRSWISAARFGLGVQGYGIDLLAMKRQHLTAAWR